VWYNAAMKRAVFACLILAGAAGTAAKADTVYYRYPALPGAATACQWFDDNINDRSIGAIIRQTDMIYNRLALRPDMTVAVNGTATTQQGKQEVSFLVDRRLMCANDEALHPAPDDANLGGAPQQ
jgi:hypothetical protein